MRKTSPLRSYLDEDGVRLSKVASDLKVDRTTLWRWSAKRVPAERVAAVSKLTGIPPHELRPDIFVVA